MTSFFRSKTSLVAENLCLRQQLLVLHRKHKRPRLQDSDRRFWILASRWLRRWQEPLLIVRPEADFAGAEGAHSSHGDRERPVGTETYPGGAGKVGIQGIREDCRQVHARPPLRNSIAGLATFSRLACPGDLGLRFLLRPDNPVPDNLCLFHHSSWQSRSGSCPDHLSPD